MRFKCPHGWTIEQRIAHYTRRDPISGCWLWQASTQRQGYGLVGWRNRVWLAHRLAWTGKYGPIPKGKILCHRCDERRCVNPDHLFLGTWRANTDDLKAKRLRRSLTARDSSRMHIFLRGLELVGEVVWENEHVIPAAAKNRHCVVPTGAKRSGRTSFQRSAADRTNKVPPLRLAPRGFGRGDRKDNGR
jgi:hypothetical protein